MKLKELFEDKIFTISNFLSLFRIFIIPLVVYFMYMDKKTGEVVYIYYQLGCLGLIILSDYLDGLLARLLNQVSKLGQFLDPAADKICAVLIFFFMCVYKDYPVWVFCIIVFREVMLFIIGFILFSKRNIEVKANMFGKTYVTFLALSAVIYTLALQYSFYGITVKQISISLLVLFYIISAISYSRAQIRNYFEEKK